ncbi:MAG TPA: DNA repair protein RadC [Fimbriimonadaceae bacterium]|nr:DNA repair protein RadC [Fimbriimonadaceae bacterium]
MPSKVEGPVDRLTYNGFASASIIDLVSVAFTRSETDALQATPMVREMLGRYAKLSSLAEATIQELTEITGQDRFELIRAQALIELGRRMGNSKRGELPEVDVPEDVARRLDHLRHEKREHFVVVLLDSKGHIQRISPVHIGTVNMSIVGAREVFREAVKDGASSIIVAHNHPSGDPTPSPEDIKVTKKLVEAGKLLDIPVLDHIIIGYDDFTSLMRKGLM